MRSRLTYSETTWRRYQTRFKSVKILGRGTYGCVFEARRSLYGEVCTWSTAVKRIPLERSERNVKEALREVNAMKSLNHPGIVTFYDAWIEEPPVDWQSHADMELKDSHTIPMHRKDCSFLFIQMELCNSSLEEWLESNEDRDLKNMKSWFKQIVSAVAYIHEKGIIHRDLKPSNILFAKDNPEQLLICDLGIGTDRFILNDNNSPGVDHFRTSSRGTEMYMAPEQKGWEYSEKVDIFALGLILTELLVPMTIDEANGVFNTMRSGKRSSIVHHCFPDAETIVCKMTSLIASERPECAEILNEDFLLDNSLEATKREFESEFLRKFSVQRILGFGGRGIAFAVVNRQDDWKYAVNRVACAATEERIRATLQEVRALARLEHPGIIRYYSSWIEEPPEDWQYETDNGILDKIQFTQRHLLEYKANSAFVYIQMQLCNYCLYDWLEENTSSESRNLFRIKLWFKQIVAAVGYIHEHNLIHRNLQPGNILFVDRDTLKIGAMGVVIEQRWKDEMEPPLTPNRSGTETYMSPEQCSFFSQIDSKSDVFTLGLILAELCVVMDADKKIEVFANYRSGRSKNIFGDDEKTATFIRKLTEKDSKQRPSCREILNDIYLS